MKRLLATALAFLGSLRAAPKPDFGAIDPVVMLDAIAAVETGNNWRKVGAAGERGRCQILEATWRRQTAAPFLGWAPVDCDFTRKIERAVLADFCRRLRAEHLSLEPCFVAAAWRYGPGNAGRCARTDYAQRVANLYFDALARKQGAKP